MFFEELHIFSFDPSRDVFVRQILRSQSFGSATVHFGPKAVGRGMQVHRLMEGRKLRNPRYSSFMIECPCAEKYLIL